MFSSLFTDEKTDAQNWITDLQNIVTEPGFDLKPA
jgi:hypothetical protein